MTIVVQFFDILLTALWYALLARVVLSWIAALAPNNPITSPNNPVFQILLQITEPILAPLRRIIPTVGMMDFTSLIALFLIGGLRSLIQVAL
ncbi:MAG: YggT family protein [Dehalococcoidia bacterium]|nr:YggT family protein [Dehalococcoidia bacterium]